MTRASSTAALLVRAFDGDRVALARVISIVENDAEGASAVLDACFRRTGRAFRVGITGPPGAGKSTLVTRIAQEYRKRDDTVAVVAVDPTSPFTGGALLGDRVRMGELAGDDGVYIRSMATRGGLGGLAVHTAQVCDVLDAAGFARVLIETVGVGQSELEVAETADTTVVVLVPESGDTVQAMKAGLMEIGDLFVINKADREGANAAPSPSAPRSSCAPSSSDWTAPCCSLWHRAATVSPSWSSASRSISSGCGSAVDWSVAGAGVSSSGCATWSAITCGARSMDGSTRRNGTAASTSWSSTGSRRIRRRGG
jgi:LAO/AO transport system ATPase